MKTVAFQATMGLSEGYWHGNTELKEAKEVVSLVWQMKAQYIFNTTSVYVTAVVSNSKAIYPLKKGCPIGGEDVATITGQCNPEVTDIDKFKESVISVLKLCKEELKQTTCQVVFSEQNFVYLSSKKEVK